MHMFPKDYVVVVLINITTGNPASMDGSFPWKSTKSPWIYQAAGGFSLGFQISYSA